MFCFYASYDAINLCVYIFLYAAKQSVFSIYDTTQDKKRVCYCFRRRLF